MPFMNHIFLPTCFMFSLTWLLHMVLLGLNWLCLKKKRLWGRPDYQTVKKKKKNTYLMVQMELRTQLRNEKIY
jgi:hypothetical protein